MTEQLSPDDPLLTAEAPYEPGAVARMYMAGWPGELLAREFRMRGTKFIKQMQQAREEIIEARSKGRPVHVAIIPEEKS